MKRTIMAIMAVCALMFTQCRKNIEQIDNGGFTGETIEVTVEASTDGDRTEITSAGVVTWVAGDVLYVVGSTSGYLGSLTAQGSGSSATFKGTLNKTTTPQTYYFYYTGSNGSISGDSYTYSVATQSGTLTGNNGVAKKLQLMKGSTSVSGATPATFSSTIPMTSMNAIARLSFKKGGSAYTDNVTLTGSYAKATLNTKTGVLTPSTSSSITLNSASSSYYVSLIPGTGSTQNLTFTTSTSETVTLNSVPVAANHFYNKDSAKAVNMVASEVHESVDLGLSVEWATCNLGATSPSGRGKYYAWGETAGYGEAMVGNGSTNAGTNYQTGNVKKTYSWSYYKWGSGEKALGKYVNKTGYGMTPPDYLTALQPADDAARANWGSDWRMPTKDDFTELNNNTTGTYKKKNESITIGGVSV